MLQQCRASCAAFAKDNDKILQDTSDTCVNFALTGGCTSNPAKADGTCRASCHIQRICGNHSETVTCSKALRCEAIQDRSERCAERAAKGQCASQPIDMLKNCLKACSETDIRGMMSFHLPHKRTTLSPLIDLPGQQPRLAGFYATPPGKRNDDYEALHHCMPAEGGGFAARVVGYRRGAPGRARAPPGDAARATPLHQGGGGGGLEPDGDGAARVLLAARALPPPPPLARGVRPRDQGRVAALLALARARLGHARAHLDHRDARRLARRRDCHEDPAE
eukprot:2780745-Prymnesium_polylepis.1